MSTRIRFGAELGYALQVRALTLSEAARLANVAVATVSAAVDGRQVNVGTALRIARAVAACPLVPELVEWVQRPSLDEVGPPRTHEPRASGDDREQHTGHRRATTARPRRWSNGARVGRRDRRRRVPLD